MPRLGGGGLLGWKLGPSGLLYVSLEGGAGDWEIYLGIVVCSDTEGECQCSDCDTGEVHIDAEFSEVIQAEK